MDTVDIACLASTLKADTQQFGKRVAANKSSKRKSSGIQKRRSKIKRVSKQAPNSLLAQVHEVVSVKEGLEYKMQRHQLPDNGFHTKLMGMHSALAHALLNSMTTRASKTVRSNVNNTLVPISSAEHDSVQLEWGRNVPLCAAGAACEATKLLQSQGPLHVYCPPTCDTESDATCCNLCLLCIRLHSEMLCKELRALQPDNVDLPSTLLPPFTNIVNAPGGYYAWCLGVSAINHGLFDRQCSIVGASPLLEVKYSPLEKKWWVCQEKILWRPSPLDFRGGAQEKPM